MKKFPVFIVLFGVLCLFIIPAEESSPVSVRFDPREIYVGEGSEFAMKVYINTGGGSLADYQIDFQYNSFTLKLQKAESGSELFPPVLWWMSGENPKDFKVFALDSEGIGSVADYHLITLRFKAERHGGSWLKMMPVSFTDRDNNKLAFLPPQAALIHVAPPGELQGDSDGNGYVTIVDALDTAQFAVGITPAGFLPGVSDVNCDGVIDMLDTLLIARYASGLIADFPCRGFPTPAPVSTPLVFPDPGFEDVIRMELDKLEGDVYAEDMRQMRDLYLYDWPVAELTGLESCQFLESLTLETGSDLNLSPLASLPVLTDLKVRATAISDYAPVTSIPSLVTLFLECPGMNTGFEFGDLASLPYLRHLSIHSWVGSDISWLEDLRLLRTLSLEYAGIEDISVLSGFTDLETLALQDNAIRDIASLSGLRELKSLVLSGNNIPDLSPLGGLIKLENLYLKSNLISDLSALSGLRGLKTLNMNGNRISDITALSALRAMETLSLDNNDITNLTPLANMSDLSALSLCGNGLSDLSALAGLTKLENISLDYNEISDTAPLAGLPVVKVLYLNHNNISDVSLLAGLTGLEILYLRRNPITPEDLAVLRAALPGTKVYF